jgi:hypothetical protein
MMCLALRTSLLLPLDPIASRITKKPATPLSALRATVLAPHAVPVAIVGCRDLLAADPLRRQGKPLTSLQVPPGYELVACGAILEGRRCVNA